MHALRRLMGSWSLSHVTAAVNGLLALWFYIEHDFGRATFHLVVALFMFDN